VDFTDHGAEQTLQWALGQGTPAPPATLWIQLHIGDPGPTGVDNPAGNTERQQATFGAITSPGATASTGGGDAEALTDADIVWEGLAATETYSHISLWDDQAAGNSWYKGDLVAPVAVVAGGIFQFLAQNGLAQHA